MAGFRSEVEGQTVGAFRGIGKKVAATIGVTLGAQAVYGLVKSSTQAAAQTQRQTQTIEANFGQAGKAVIKFADTAGIALGATSGATEEASTKFGLMFNALGVGQKQAAGMTVQWERLALALNSVQGGGSSGAATMLGLIQQLASGRSARGLAQLGLAFTTDQQKAALFAETGQKVTGALTTGQKAQANYLLAMKHLPEIMTQAKAHIRDFVNVQARLTAEWAQAKTQLGQALLPEMTRYGTSLTHWLTTMVRSGQLQKDFNGIVRATVTAVKLLVSAVKVGVSIWHGFSQAVGGTGNAMRILLAGMAAYKFLGITNSIVGVVRRIQDMGRAAAAASAAQVAAQATTAASTAASAVAMEAQTAAATSAAASDRVAAAAAAFLAESNGAVAEEAGVESAALLELQAALDALATASAAASAAQEALAGAEVAAGVAADAEAIGGLVAFRGGLAALATSIPVVGAAVVGLGLGLGYLVTREGAVAAATKDLGDAFVQFATAQDQVKQAGISLAQAHLAIGSDRGAIAAARSGVQAARAALANSLAAHGTAAYASLVRNLASAQNQYRSAIVQLSSDQLRLNQAQNANAKSAGTLGGASKKAYEQIRTLLTAVRGEAVGADVGARGWRSHAQAQKIAADTVAKFESSLAGLIPKLQQQSPLVAHNTELLLEYVQQTGRIPTQKVTDIILRSRNLKATIEDIDAKLKHLDPMAYADGVLAGKALARGIAAGVAEPGFLSHIWHNIAGPLIGVSAKVQAQARRELESGTTTPALVAKQFGLSAAQIAAIQRQTRQATQKADVAAKAAAAKAKPLARVIPFRIQLELAQARTPAAQRKALIDELDALNAELRRHLTLQDRIAVEQEKTNVISQLQSLAKAAIQTAASVNTSIASIVQAAQQRIRSSVDSAKNNLVKIGSDLAKTIDTIQQKIGGAVGGVAGSPQGKAFEKLKKLIESGAPSFEIAKAQAELSGQLQDVGKTQQSGAGKSSAQRELADLTAEFNKGKISDKQFIERLHKILKEHGITIGAAMKAGGRAFADTYKAQVAALKAQAKAIADVPAKFRKAGGAGGAADIKIIRPLEVIKEEANKIAVAAAKQRATQIKHQAAIQKYTAKTAQVVEGGIKVKQDGSKAAPGKAPHPVKSPQLASAADRIVHALRAVCNDVLQADKDIVAANLQTRTPVENLRRTSLRIADEAGRQRARMIRNGTTTNALLRRMERTTGRAPGFNKERKGTGGQHARTANAVGVKP